MKSQPPPNPIRPAKSRHPPPIGTARDNGRVQRAAIRLFGLKDVISTAELARWVYGWRAMQQGREIRAGEYDWVRRTLDRVADRVGRGGGLGRPILWKLRKVN